MTEMDQLQMEKIADCEHEIFALLKQRYSPRTFALEKLRDMHLKQLFEAARWSASSNNLQPWRFLYAHRGTAPYGKMLACLSDFNQKWAKNAPMLMLTAYRTKDAKGRENFHALHDLGQAVAQMGVQAQYMGIGMHQMAGVNWKKAQRVFEVPEAFHIATAVAVGYYGGRLEDLPQELRESETSTRERFPQADFAFKEAWREK
ncbi:nitroreductase family protein [Maribacter sp. 2307ULW6-5]